MPIDFEERTVEKLDQISEMIRDLCNRQTKTETQLEDHFNRLDEETKNKERKFYYLIALMGVGFTLFEIFKGLV